MVTIIKLLVGLVVKTTLTVTQTPFNNKSRRESKAISALGLEGMGGCGSYIKTTLRLMKQLFEKRHGHQQKANFICKEKQTSKRVVSALSVPRQKVLPSQTC